MANRYLYTTPISVRDAKGEVAAIYAQLRRDLGSVAEPLALHAPLPDLLGSAWAILRETLLAGQVARGQKEAVAATVSTRNRCPWCIDIHSMMLQAAGHPQARLAIADGQVETIIDPSLRAIVAWADQPVLDMPPVAPAAVPELIGTAVTFHYLNRMVNALLMETFLPQARWARRTVAAALPWLLRPLARRSYTAGESLRWVRAADLPSDLSWAQQSPPIAHAFAGFAAVVDQHSQRALPASARAIIGEQLAVWNGVAPPLSRSWVEQAIAGLGEPEAAAARLGLLAALASYQIDEGVVAAYRRHYPGDASLVAALAWASFAAATAVTIAPHGEERTSEGGARPGVPHGVAAARAGSQAV
jgi:AhpD family alkylhydroperoxidase